MNIQTPSDVVINKSGPALVLIDCGKSLELHDRRVLCMQGYVGRVAQDNIKMEVHLDTEVEEIKASIEEHRLSLFPHPVVS